MGMSSFIFYRLIDNKPEAERMKYDRFGPLRLNNIYGIVGNL